MSKVYDAVMRAQRERDSGLGEGGRLRDRLREWMPRRRQPEPVEPREILEAVEFDLETVATADDVSTLLEEKIASFEVAVSALDDRISSEIVEREAKLLEEIGRGMRGLETELLHRMASTGLELKRTVRVGTAVSIGVGVLLAGIAVGVVLSF